MGLCWRIRWGYAVGHVLNDLCASVWFTYTLVYFKFAVGVPTTLAGFIVLIGQIADGLATPVVGFLSDKCTTGPAATTGTYERFTNSPDENPTCSSSPIEGDTSKRSMRESARYRGILAWIPSGRKAYHFGGSLLVIISFPLLFGSPVAEAHISTWAKILYYTAVAILFQIGWASVQITHLAMMNDLSLIPGERTLLTSLRYLFTVFCNLGVYVCTYLFLKPSGSRPYNTTTIIPATSTGSSVITENPASVAPALHTLHLAAAPLVVSSHPCVGQPQMTSAAVKENVDFGPGDLLAFRYLSLAIIGVGSLMTIVFHVAIRQSDYVVKACPSPSALTDSTSIRKPDLEAVGLAQATTLQIRTWRDWLRVPLFWVQAFAYMTSRLIVNVTQVYLTVYLLHSLLLSKDTITLVPLTVYLTSMATMVVQKPVQDKISRELNTIIGLSFITIFCVLVNYPGDPVNMAIVYSAAGVLGVGCTIILITALAMVSDLIGHNQDNGAFVYGYMSFVDKLFNGLTIQMVEVMWNEFPDRKYYQRVESYGIGGWVVTGVIFLVAQTIVKKWTYGQISLIWAPKHPTQ
ncbi:unnamed protein product [Calicophoron daubneyi]|uniref:Uncharacterized protein n=1 Tax=Calicophoron daubneyi TaxID=300641 RepID=A0AAV2T262_CALDB